MLQDILAKHVIYTWKKVIWRKAVINIFFTDQNETLQSVKLKSVWHMLLNY